MRASIRLSALLLCLCLLLTACSGADGEGEAPSQAGSDASAPTVEREPEERPVAAPAYVRLLARELLDGLVTPEMDHEERILAVYRHLMETVYFADPLGLDIWRYREGGGETPSFVETRALSPLAFGVGSCEDFAAALVVLLEEMGYEAQYVPGYTLSVDGEYVDHAWTVVKVEGNWYHLDAQLEQNVVRDGVTRYRYFLKSDEDLFLDHKWGENLIDYWPEPISQADQNRIRERYTPPACTGSWPPLEPAAVTLPPRPDLHAIHQEIQLEKALSSRYLPDIPLNDRPPVLIGGAETDAAAVRFQYGRGFLEGDALALYDALCHAADNLELEAAVAAPASLAAGEVERVVSYLLDDNPGLYWAQPAMSENAAGSRSFSLGATLTAPQILQREEEIRLAAQALLEGLSGDPVEMAWQVHNRMIQAIDYEREDTHPDVGNHYGGLVEGSVICDGYARTYQYLMDSLGIECVTLRGSSFRGVAHAWNAVRLEGAWYYVDVTWDKAASDGEDIAHEYLCITAEESAAQHHWQDGQYPVLPEGESTAACYYTRNGYTVDLSQPDPAAQLSRAFAAQLADRAGEAGSGEVFLEVKLLGDAGTYQQAKAAFIKDLYGILDHLESDARQGGRPYTVRTTGEIRCNYNDAVQVLILYPSIQPV